MVEFKMANKNLESDCKKFKSDPFDSKTLSADIEITANIPIHSIRNEILDRNSHQLQTLQSHIFTIPADEKGGNFIGSRYGHLFKVQACAE